MATPFYRKPRSTDCVRANVMFIVLMQNNYYQYEQGFLEEEVWSDMRQTLKDSLREPYNKRTYF